ncbi:hypothetical protein MKY51_07735 [Solibacillus sp. FSL R5-0691]|uniref:hypothetical protein n=1 Tax=Solibacillus sp. FSL R5-0691 TaxID=2921653 RepID=UPI0030D5FC71
MGGDAIVWLVILLSILICDGLAVYLYRKRNFPLWTSAIIIALLVPVIVYSFVALGINYFNRTNTDPDSTGEGIAFAGGFIAIILAFNAIVMFVIGVILTIYTFIKKKRWKDTANKSGDESEISKEEK